MKLTIIVPTRPNIENIKNILVCLKKQNFQDFQTFFVVDTILDKKEYEDLTTQIYNFIQKKSEKNKDFSKELKDNNIHFFTNQNSDFKPWKNASATRNYWIKQANTKFLYLFDDDNLINPDHLQKTFDIYKDQQKTLNKEELVLVWTLMYRHTWNIQNQGFKSYNYLMSRPRINFLKNKKYDQIRMYSWNWLFWPSHIFQEDLYDEVFDFVAEDLECTYRITQKHPMVVTSELEVYHMERDKTYLEEARVWNEFGAYRKAKHRILFVKKHWTIFEKTLFYIFWLHWNNFRLSAKILIWWKKERWKILKSFWKWNLDWLLYYQE